MIRHNDITSFLKNEEEARIWKLLEDVCDPEVPVLSVLDLGIVRNVKVSSLATQHLEVEITITPTYSGCPAMDMIAMNIKMHLLSHDFKSVKINSVLTPAWTTEWMTEAGKNKLKIYGIAAPHKLKDQDSGLGIECPQCNSINTCIISQFGSTACKALYKCNECKEPFDYFKCH